MRQTFLTLCLCVFAWIAKSNAQPIPDFLTNQEVFNFNIGDTFQYEYQENMRSEKILRIIEQYIYVAKWQSADQQTWFYKRQISRDTQFCMHENPTFICPVLPQTHHFFDTISVVNLNNNVFPNDLPTNPHPLWEAYEVLGIDRNLYNSRMFQERVWGYRGALLEVERFAKGLGKVWYEQRSEVGRCFTWKLVFFNKNGETWGQRQIFTPPTLPRTNENIKIFPNPVVNFVEVSTEKELFDHVKIFDMTGRQVFERSLGYETYVERIDLTAINKDTGLYFIQLFNNNKRIATAKILLK